MTDPDLIDFDRLLELRLVVARFGEMDRARWWNTKGMLGRQGRQLYRRGFPRTHRFAQARAVFTVARARCEAYFTAPGTVTLWTLPAELEDQFDARWHDWLEQREEWDSFFEKVEELPSDDLVGCLCELELIDPGVAEAARSLRRSGEGRAVALSGTYEVGTSTLALLAAAFSRGEPGKPAVPYARFAG